jgi:hypothetical protein
LKLRDGSPAPEYLSIDEFSGEVKFLANTADREVNDLVVIIISSTDGVQNRLIDFDYPYQLRTEPKRVRLKCGPESTAVSLPTLSDLI